MRPLKVLVVCEESQTVTKAFRDLGHYAFSCDLQECSGGHPEWHYQGDYRTADKALRKLFDFDEWDLIIAHPPCTYLSRAGARWLYKGGELQQDRYDLLLEGREFFMSMFELPCKHLAVENPTPFKIANLPKHDQVIQPYEYGHPYSKRTLLWFRDLPALIPTNIINEYTAFLPSNSTGHKKGQKSQKGTAHTAKDASKTFMGIADAMAKQWSIYIINKKGDCSTL